MSTANVLSIAGTDPSGGAGLLADVKTFGALGVYGMGAISAMTVQNTQGVQDIHRPPASVLAHQLACIAEDIRIDAVKLGMLFDAELIEVVSSWLESQQVPIVVLDPVMVATSGDTLLVPQAQSALAKLAKSVTLITPNVPELAVLATVLGHPCDPAQDVDTALAQAQVVAEATGAMVVAKGGHLDGVEVIDALVFPDGTVHRLSSPRVDTTNTHGTGCSLSSALTALAAKDARNGQAVDWRDVLARAKDWMTLSLVGAGELEVGQGHGPINHYASLWAAGGSEPRLTGQQVLTQWWDRIADLRSEIDDLDFVARLGDGTLEPERFQTYLAQDALYLTTYSRVLAQASALAPERRTQAFWAKGAWECIEVEMALHDSWITDSGAQPRMDETTTGYTNHLLSRAQLGHYGELVAAILPCYWLYQDIGERLLARNHPDHPFQSWLAMYGDTAFAEATIQACAFVAEALDTASDEERERMWQAFYQSSLWEQYFFDR